MDDIFRRWALAGAIAGACALGLVSTANADDWVPSARTAAGDLYETDLNALTRTGSVVQSWTRETLVRPQRDTASGKSFVTELDQRYDDCQVRRFKFGQVTRRGKSGDVVSSGLVPNPWQDIIPESVAEGVNRVVCRASEPPAEKALFGKHHRRALGADRHVSRQEVLLLSIV